MLDGPQTSKLVQILRDRFLPDTFDTFLLTSFNRRASDISTVPNFPGVVFAVVQDFDSHGQLVAFLDAVVAYRPADALLQGLFAPFRAILPQPEKLPQKLQSLTFGENPSFPFVNRHELRNHLQHITQDNSQWRVLSLHGMGTCGKTYSWNFIREIALTIGRRPVYADLSQSNFELMNACEEIARRLDLGWEPIKKMLEDDPQPQQVARRFWRELGVHSAKLSDSCWLVVDGLSSPKLDADVSQYLIPRLLAEISINPLPNVFPILIGENAKTVRQVRSWALHEQLKNLERPEIESHILAWCVERKFALAQHDLENALAEILAVPPDVEESARHEYIRDNLIEFLERIEKSIKKP